MELQRAKQECMHFSVVECYSAEYDLEGCPHRAAAEAAEGFPFQVSGARRVGAPMAAGGQVFSWRRLVPSFKLFLKPTLLIRAREKKPNGKVWKYPKLPRG